MNQIENVEPQYFKIFSERLDNRLDIMDKEFKDIHEKLDEHTQKFRKVDEKLSEIDGKLSEIDGKLSEIDGKLIVIDEKIDSHTEMIGELMVKTTQIHLDMRGKANLEYVKKLMGGE